MRNEMEQLLKNELRILAIKTRDKLGITQKEMSERLVMSESSYSDIETGKYMCGTLTMILLLIEQKNPSESLEEWNMSFTDMYEGAMLPG